MGGRSTGTLWQLYKELAPHQQSYAKLFTIVKGRRGPAPRDGFGADYAGSLSIEEVLYIAVEGFDCNYKWQQFSLRALGNEPYWSATVVADGITVTQLSKPEISFYNVTKQHAEQSVRYQGKNKENEFMTLVISKEPCRDAMSGAYYGLMARLKLSEEELTGCAIQGDAD